MKLRYFYALLMLLGSTAVAAPGVAGKDVWTLTTADFRSEAVQLLGLDGKGARIATAAGGAERTIGLDQFLQLDRTAARAGATGPFVATLTSGDRIIGEPASTTGETITWKNRALGELKISMRTLATIARQGVTTQADEAGATEDVVTLLNGDVVRGTLESIDATSVSIQPSAGGESTRVALESVAAVSLASTGPKPAPTSQKRFRIALADGTLLAVESATLEKSLIRLGGALDGATRSVPLDVVASIEQLDGPVMWLSYRTPTETVQTPYLDTTWPTRMNATVSGEPIRIAGKTFARGIGVHSYSRISWPIANAMRAFRTQYAIDGDQPYADVTVRIKLDGKVAFEKTGVRSGEISPLVTLDVAGAKTITLEVDYGANGDVQDRFNWIEPALLKYKPEPPKPTTVPTPSTQP